MASYRWEMGILREEFVRLLPVAVGGNSSRIEATRSTATDGACAWRPCRSAGSRSWRFLLGYQRAGG